MTQERVLETLASYTGTAASMQEVVGVLTEEMGADWTASVFSDLSDAPTSIKKKLKHVFNYYAATTAWNEAQEYLAQTTPLDMEEMASRIPVLKHWLDFFGDDGRNLLDELGQKILDQGPEGQALIQQFSEQTQKQESVSTDSQSTSTERPQPQPKQIWHPEEMRVMEEGKVLTTSEIEAELKENEPKEEKPKEPEQVPDSPEAFTVRKVIAQIDLLKSAQSWLAARCVSLKNIEVYAYPFYGFMVDLLRQTLKDMESLQEKPELNELIDKLYPNGKQAFEDQKTAIQNDISLAEQNCESAMTALISEDMDMDAVRKTLGSIDDSGTVEYLGPAPDGFEVLDMDTPLDESAIKEQYAKIEGKDMNAQPNTSPSSSPVQQNTSQSSKNGVQRKLSFSLKAKKPTGDAS